MRLYVLENIPIYIYVYVDMTMFLTIKKLWKFFIFFILYCQFTLKHEYIYILCYNVLEKNFLIYVQHHSFSTWDCVYINLL